MADWIVWGILVALLALFFFLYLMARRTVTEFKDGLSGKDRGS